MVYQERSGMEVAPRNAPPQDHCKWCLRFGPQGHWDLADGLPSGAARLLVPRKRKQKKPTGCKPDRLGELSSPSLGPESPSSVDWNSATTTSCLRPASLKGVRR